VAYCSINLSVIKGLPSLFTSLLVTISDCRESTFVHVDVIRDKRNVILKFEARMTHVSETKFAAAYKLGRLQRNTQCDIRAAYK